MKLFKKGRSLKPTESDTSSRSSRQLKVDEVDEISSCYSKRKSSDKAMLESTPTVSSSGSSEDLRRELIDFKISIESLDGIISTNTGQRHRNIGQLGAPVFGIVSYSTKLPENGKVVKTNLPSLPLIKSTSSIGNRDRFHACFGYPDGESNVLEQINLTLPMTRNKSAARRSEYRERRFDLDINLMRGSEVIKIGFASISLNGTETGESRLIQVGQEKLVRTTRRKGNKRIPQTKKTTIGVRSVSFMKDPSRRFSLQRANLRVNVQARASSRRTATAKYAQKCVEDAAPLLHIISTDKSTESDAEKSEGFKCNSNDDSLLDKLSGISLSQSDETISAEDKYSQFLSKVRNPSVDESDIGTTCTDDGNLSKIGFVKFTDGASVASGFVSADGDETVTTLDNISLGTIKFKGLSNDEGVDVPRHAKRKSDRSLGSLMLQRSKLCR